MTGYSIEIDDVRAWLDARGVVDSDARTDTLFIVMGLERARRRLLKRKGSMS